MLRTYTLVTAPAVEPVLLSEAKTFCRVDGTADDTFLTSLIVAGRQLCEEFTKSAFITQSWRCTLDAFPPVVELEGYHLAPRPTAGDSAIYLSRRPIQEITSIKTRDRENTQTTVDTEVYTLDISGGRLLLNDSQNWPTDLREFAAVEIEHTSGYGDDASAVPYPIKQAILQTVDALYQGRACAEPPEGAKALLAPYKQPEAFGCEL